MMESLTEEDDVSDNVEEFDRNLPAAHSYLPGGLTSISGRSILDPGWVGKIPCWCHHSVVFPGESIPMHFPDLAEYRFGTQFGCTQRLFGLLFPDDNNQFSGYGVLCEVVEASEPFESDDDLRRQISLKTQARQRFKVLNYKNWELSFQRNKFIKNCDIKIMPDVVVYDPLQGVRLFSRVQKNSGMESLRKADSIVTPLPHFVHEMFDMSKIVGFIKQYFKELSLENLPDDAISLSFWVASNLTISISDHLFLFKIDNALLRLYLEMKYCQKNKIFCGECASNSCDTEISSVGDIIPMSKEGLHSNYCNVGGYVHGVVTVKDAKNVILQGLPSLEFTWFPGYYWTIGICLQCREHLGWKFTATKKTLRPQSFWGLTRNAIITDNSAAIDEDDD